MAGRASDARGRRVAHQARRGGPRGDPGRDSRTGRRRVRLALERPPQAREPRRGRLRGQLEAHQRQPQERHPRQADHEREQHRAGEASGGGEGPRVDERLRQAHGEEVERHEGARGDREHRRVAGLALAVLDRVAQRVVGRVEQEDDQEADQGRLVPDPPLAPLGPRPDRAGDEDGDPEDDREVDGDVGACVVHRVAAAQVADRVDPGDHEAGERADRERHVQVEDLLDEALGVERRVEEDQREAGREDRDRCRCLGSQARDLMFIGRRAMPPDQSSSRKS